MARQEAAPARKAWKALREFALAYPETHEDHPWGHSAIKVRGKKVFVFLSGEDEEVVSVTAKLPASADMALILPFAEPTGYGMGRHGWVTARFEPGEDLPVELLCEWIDESYRAIAPKKLVGRLPAEGPGDAGSRGERS